MNILPPTTPHKCLYSAFWQHWWSLPELLPTLVVAKYSFSIIFHSFYVNWHLSLRSPIYSLWSITVTGFHLLYAMNFKNSIHPLSSLLFFDVQNVSDLPSGNLFELLLLWYAPINFWTLSCFRYKIIQPHIEFFLPRIWNKSFLQGSGFFSGKWYLATKFCGLGILIATRMSLPADPLRRQS